MSIFDDDPTTMSTTLSNEGLGVMDAPMAGSLLPSFSSAMSWPESFEESMEVAWYQWDPHYQPHADEDEHQSFMRKMKEAAAFNEWVQRGSESSHAPGAGDKTLESTDEGDSFLRKTQVHGGPGGPSQANTRDERLPLPIPGTGDRPGDIGVTIPGAGARNPDYIPPADPDPGNRGSSDDSDDSGNRGGNRGPGNAGTEETQEDETQGNSDDRVPGERLNPPEVPMPNTWDELQPLPIPGTGDSPGTGGIRVPNAGARNPDHIPPRRIYPYPSSRVLELMGAQHRAMNDPNLMRGGKGPSNVDLGPTATWCNLATYGVLSDTDADLARLLESKGIDYTRANQAARRLAY